MAPLQASNILLFGATGFIGQHITSSIVSAQPAFRHVTIFTSKETVESKGELLEGWTKAGNVTVVTGSVDSEADVRAAYKEHNIDTVVCAFGRGAIAKQIELIKWADEDGVKWFFPSEYGTDIEYGPKSKDEKPHQQKLAVRKFIRENVKQLQVTYVVTGPYFESWVGRLPGLVEVCPGYDAKTKKALLIEDGEGRVGFTTMPDVGKLVVAALQHPEAAAGKALKVNSFEVTPKQVLAQYEKLTGDGWTVEYVPLSKVEEVEKKLWAEGNPKATIITLRRIWAEGGTLYEKTDNAALGLKPEDMESLEAVLKRIL
ncbi:hypothetical protein N0V82_008874 [Gnomoniopsis sp. IMI 355080]|nr:hypothetical protein N0V82_008874 [Gnomoniopsis sp. IMI 355080]